MKKIVLGIIFVLVFVRSGFTVSTGWFKSKKVSVIKGINKYPAVFSDKNSVVCTWVNSDKKATLYFSVYNGTKWSKPVKFRILKNKKILRPSSYILKNNIYIAYSDNENRLNIFCAGSNFQTNIIFTDTRDIVLPKFKVINNRLYVFYENNINKEYFNISYRRLEQGELIGPESTLIANISSTHGLFFPNIKNYADKVYVIWNKREGSGHRRYDKLLMKITTTDLKSDLKNMVLSEGEEDVLFSDFYVDGEKMYLAYVYTVLKNNEISTKIKFKVLDLNSYRTINSISTNLGYNNFYGLKIKYFKNRFYVFYYSYKKKKANIYYSESTDFIDWEQPGKITTGGIKNRYFDVIEYNNNLSLIYQKEYRRSSDIYFKERDNICNPPVVYSPTHKEDKWSYKTKVILKWKQSRDDSGIKGYSYIIDRNKDTEPDIINLTPMQRKYVYNCPANGIYYFHLRSIDNSGNWSKTSTYKFMVNSDVPSAPIISSPTHKEFIPSNNLSPVFKWSMSDNRDIKGYSYIFTQLKEEVPPEHINTRKKTVKFKNIKPGVWYFKVRACDPFNRWTDYSVFTVNIEKILIASGVTEEMKSRYTYTVGNGENLVSIINKVLQLTNSLEYRKYIKGVAKFNYLQNYDFLKPGDKVMFPIILARPGDTKEKIAKHLFGSEEFSNRIVVIDKPEGNISAGDKIIVKDRMFLETGKVSGVNVQ